MTPISRVTRKISRMLHGLRRAEGLSRKGDRAFETLHVGGLTVRCGSTWPIESAAWEALCGRVPAATVFQSPAWQIAAWTAGRITGDLRFITVEQGAELLGALPLCVDGRGAIHTPGASVSDYHDPLVAPAAAEEVWRAILAFLAAHWDHALNDFILYNIRHTATCRTLLPKLAAEAGFTFEEHVFDQAPAIALPPTWESYLDSFDSHERKELRRKIKKAEIQGAAQFERCKSGKEAVLQETVAMMTAADGDKSADVSEYIRPLLLAAAPPLLADGRIELHTLHLQDNLACGLIEFPTGAGPMLYNIGINPALKQWSPGVVAVAMSIQRAITNGAIEYDLLRGREPYKYKIGGTDRPIYRLVMKR